MTEQVIFYVFAAIVLLSALYVVASGSLMRSIFMFFVTLFSMAGLFVFALADFVAITQIVVYVGGVLVLMLFAFLLSNRQILNRAKTGLFEGVKHFLPGLLVASAFFVILAILIWQANPDQIEWIKQSGTQTLRPNDNTVPILGINLMTRYLLPFEVVSVLLMMALIGAAHLARKERKI